LPLFKQRQKPFVLVYWSRDPDGTQHNQGDSLNQLTPGINGPTVLAARQNVHHNLAQIRSALKELGLEASTNIFVTADHGFSTISKQSQISYAATVNYPDVPKGFLPPGFLAIDLAHHLKLTLFNPDKQNIKVDISKGQSTKNGAIGKNPTQSEVIVAANGGSDLIYLPQSSKRQDLAKTIVAFLLQQDYVSGIFINDSFGNIPGTLPFSSIGLKGGARTPTMCGVEIADTGLQQGQGIHGSFSRADTFNTMMAVGPDFKQRFEDAAPASNADVPRTIAKILGLNLKPQGKLVGRVLTEALAGSNETVTAKSQILESNPAANGLKTVLKYQTVGRTRYYDTAGFPGRTLGL
jgi:arylsulfatase A-like enzyme